MLGERWPKASLSLSVGLEEARHGKPARVTGEVMHKPSLVVCGHFHGNAEPWGDVGAFHTHPHARERALSGTHRPTFKNFF